MDPLRMAEELGVEVYACDNMTGRGDCTVADGVPVIWVNSRLRREERDHVIWKLLLRLRRKALATSAAELPQALSLH